jgi:hypothetical protein
MYLFDFIRDNTDKFEEICKAHTVEKLYALVPQLLMNLTLKKVI